MRFLIKSALLALSLVLAAAASAEKVTLHSKGKDKGAMVLETKVNPDGSLSGTMEMSLFTNHFHYSSHILASGMPTERDLVATGSQGQNLATTEIYGPHSAKITINNAGKKTSLNLPYTNGGSPKEDHLFWFFKTHPKIGAVDTYLYFNFATKQWEKRTTKYAGDDKVPYHGKGIMAHKLIEGDNASWVDNKGLPYIVDYGKMRVRFLRD
jgi:hypothetical protein